MHSILLCVFSYIHFLFLICSFSLSLHWLGFLKEEFMHVWEYLPFAFQYNDTLFSLENDSLSLELLLLLEAHVQQDPIWLLQIRCELGLSDTAGNLGHRSG